MEFQGEKVYMILDFEKEYKVCYNFVHYWLRKNKYEPVLRSGSKKYYSKAVFGAFSDAFPVDNIKPDPKENKRFTTIHYVSEHYIIVPSQMNYDTED